MSPDLRVDGVAAVASMRAPRREVADLFWDVRAWHEIWSGIESVEVVYDDGVHQEFTMTVYRGGVEETVRTIRYRHADGGIEFFTPQCPPGMVRHSGRWRFVEDPHDTGRCEVVAERRYVLAPGAPGQEVSAAARDAYRTSFTDRLQAILVSFAEHFEHTDDPGSTRFARCTARRVLPVPAGTLSAYLADAPHLPEWTTFFTGCLGVSGGRCLMRTVLGTTVLASVDSPHEGLFIVSAITDDGEERALVTVHPLGDESVVRMTMWLRRDGVEWQPGELDDAVRAQEARLGDELLHLARHAAASADQDDPVPEAVGRA